MSCFYFPFLPLRVLSSLGVVTQFLWKLGHPWVWGGWGVCKEKRRLLLFLGFSPWGF